MITKTREESVVILSPVKSKFLCYPTWRKDIRINLSCLKSVWLLYKWGSSTVLLLKIWCIKILISVVNLWLKSAMLQIHLIYIFVTISTIHAVQLIHLRKSSDFISFKLGFFIRKWKENHAICMYSDSTSYS